MKSNSDSAQSIASSNLVVNTSISPKIELVHQYNATESGALNLNANRSTTVDTISSSLVPETEKKGRFLIKNVKGTGAASTSAPSALSIASANINSNPMTQPAIITTTTIEDRNASTKLLDISHQTPETRDISSSQPVPSNTSVLGPGISNPLPFPAIATASPKHTSAANMVTTEESAAVGTSSGNPNSTESGSNNTVTTEMTTAKKKISRFIVKSVPKEEDESRLPDPPVGPKLVAPPRAVAGPGAGATSPPTEPSVEMYNVLNSRLEQLLAMNTQIMEFIASDSFRKISNIDSSKGSSSQEQGTRPVSDHSAADDGAVRNMATANPPATSLSKVPSSGAIALSVPGTKGIAMTDSLPSPAPRALTLDVSHIRSSGPSSAASPAAPSLPASEKREPSTSLPATSPLTAPSFKDREKSAMQSVSSNPIVVAGGSSSSSGGMSAVSEEKDKDNSMAKLSHYLLEMKKELEVAQKQRREKQLETQRLREKCQQLEDQLKAEQSKTLQQSERQKKLQLLLDDRNALLAAQALKIEQLQAALAASKAAAVSEIVTPSVPDSKQRSSDSGGGGIL